MKISIVTASYNYEQYLPRCIESVLAQTYQDWELIVVDDTSSDNSVEVIKSFCEQDNRIKLVQNEANKGLKETLLTGLSHATGDWIAFLESDDFLKPENLQKKAEVINKNPEAKLVFNKVDFLWDKDRPDYNKKKFEQTQKKLSRMTFPRNMFYDFFIQNMILTFSCVMVKKSELSAQDFNSPVDALIDWWLWIHIAYKNKFYYIEEPLTDWNLHQQSYITKSKKVLLPQLYPYLDVYRKNKDFRILLFLIFSTPILVLKKLKNLISAG